MKIKKIVLAFLIILLGVCAFGCSTEEKKLQKELQKELDDLTKKIQVADLDAIVSNKVLFNEVQEVYEITWSVSGTDKVRIKRDRNNVQMLEVDRPEVNEAGISFTLKATVKNSNNQTSVKEFEDCYVRPHKDAFTNVNCEGAWKASAQSYLRTSGTVTFVASGAGFWINDGSDYSLYIYTAGDPSKYDVRLGDKVEVIGTKAVYYSTQQLTSPNITIKEFGNGTYDYATAAPTVAIDNIKDYNVKDDMFGGNFYKFEGIIVTDPNGRYKYGIQSIYSNYAVTLYDNFISAADAEFLKVNIGKYVKGTFLLHDSFSYTYFRFVPIDGTLKLETEPVLTTEQKMALAKSKVESIAKAIYADVQLPTSIDRYADVVISWTSDKPDILSNTGKFGTSAAVSEEVKLTATIKIGDIESTIEVDVVVWFVTKSTIKQANTIIDTKAKGTVVWVEGKIIALDSGGRFYIADGTGVTYIYKKLADYAGLAVGDSVKIIGTTELYVGSGNTQYTREIIPTSVEKLTTAITPLASVKVELETLTAAKMHAGTALTTEEKAAIANSQYYSGLYEVTGYVSVRTVGSNTNVYISVTDSTTGAAVLYHYSSAYQNEMKLLDGKLVTMVFMMADYSVTYGWRLGTYISLTEVAEE